MKKTIKLTERDLTRIIRRVISESANQESQQKITTLRKSVKSDAKMSPCWTKGMCPKTEAGQIYRNECESCPGPVAGILIPTVGLIAAAVVGVMGGSEKRKRQNQENKWILENPELEGRTFTYFKDGSVQATKEGFAQDVMIYENGVWKNLNEL
jgi:hypothetical protein